MSDLSGKVAFVAGANGGIGGAIAAILAEHGADVFASARDMTKAASAASEAGGSARPIVLDCVSRASWEAAMDEVRGAFGKLHILVNATGISYGNTIVNGTEEDLRKHMAINVDGIFLGCQAALPLLGNAGGMGSIINIGSVIAARPHPLLLAYGASKAAMTWMSQSIALYCAQQQLGVRVNVIQPGGVQTEIFEQALVETGLPREEAYALWRDTHPIGRIGTPREIAEAALWLASDASSFVTGTEIYVDGGASIRS